MIAIQHDALEEYCREKHIQSLSIFGSASRDTYRPDSDVDLLVEFEKGHVPGWEVVGIADDLSQFFENRPVDLVFPDAIIPRLRDRILNSAILLYRAPHE